MAPYLWNLSTSGSQSKLVRGSQAWQTPALQRGRTVPKRWQTPNNCSNFCSLYRELLLSFTRSATCSAGKTLRNSLLFADGTTRHVTVRVGFDCAKEHTHNTQHARRAGTDLDLVVSLLMATPVNKRQSVQLCFQKPNFWTVCKVRIAGSSGRLNNGEHVWCMWAIWSVGINDVHVKIGLSICSIEW